MSTQPPNNLHQFVPSQHNQYSNSERRLLDIISNEWPKLAEQAEQCAAISLPMQFDGLCSGLEGALLCRFSEDAFAIAKLHKVRDIGERAIVEAIWSPCSDEVKSEITHTKTRLTYAMKYIMDPRNNLLRQSPPPTRQMIEDVVSALTPAQWANKWSNSEKLRKASLNKVGIDAVSELVESKARVKLLERTILAAKEGCTVEDIIAREEKAAEELAAAQREAKAYENAALLVEHEGDSMVRVKAHVKGIKRATAFIKFDEEDSVLMLPRSLSDKLLADYVAQLPAIVTVVAADEIDAA